LGASPQAGPARLDVYDRHAAYADGLRRVAGTDKRNALGEGGRSSGFAAERIGQLRVAVLLHELRHALAPAPASERANDRVNEPLRTSEDESNNET
jgi:hypothetical protein